MERKVLPTCTEGWSPTSVLSTLTKCKVPQGCSSNQCSDSRALWRAWLHTPFQHQQYWGTHFLRFPQTQIYLISQKIILLYDTPILGKINLGKGKKKVSFMQFHFFITEKEIKVATALDANLHRKKTQLNYVKWNQPNKKWKLDVFTVQSSHHLWNAKCYSQEREAQVLHVLSDRTRALRA